MEIRSVTHIELDTLRGMITGYTSAERYAVYKSETDAITTFTLQLEKRDPPYVKVSNDPDAEQWELYQKVLPQGFSFGVYEGDTLIGIALAEPHPWNKTLWVWEFHVAEAHRGQGIGSQLMEVVVQKGREAGLRAVFCETQTTNVPAIRFYRKVGFTLDALNLSLYTNDDWPDGEMAVFMKRKL